MQTIKSYIALLFLCVVLNGCYNGQTKNTSTTDTTYNAEEIDSLTFLHNHHYTRNYNFVVATDSLVLSKSLPYDVTFRAESDTVVIRKHENIVVADVSKIEGNNDDSIWVRVARDQYTFGWTTENELMAGVVPDDPISQFIMYFSNTHLMVFIFVISIITILYVLHIALHRKAKVVHFNDIASFYPTLLSIIVASAATFYSSIQLFAPEQWQHFYYHPTLNPFSLPPILAIFLCSVWAMVIVGIAAVDDIFHNLSVSEAILYTGGLCAVCAALYIVFSIATLYYIGYPLLLAYVCFGIQRYFKYGRYTFKCGNCGADLHKKGPCPHCGAINE